jgi:hypothetical protein
MTTAVLFKTKTGMRQDLFACSYVQKLLLFLKKKETEVSHVFLFSVVPISKA